MAGTPGPEEQRALSSLPAVVELAFHPGGQAPRSEAMEQWLLGLAERSGGRVTFHREDAHTDPHPPSVRLQAPGGSSIRYHFVPHGPELPPFEALLWELAQPQPDGPARGSPLGGDGTPRELLLFVSEHCTNCPAGVRTVNGLAVELPRLSVHVLEALVHTELAEMHAVKSVPTLLVDGALRYVGEMDRERLHAVLASEDPRTLRQEQTRQHIQGGRAKEAGAWIAEGGDPTFLLGDLRTSTFQSRVGLLLALEEALELRPECLDPLVTPMLALLEAEDAGLRGDVADLLGKIGRPEALQPLERLGEDPNPDVAEAAQDAVEAIREARRGP